MSSRLHPRPHRGPRARPRRPVLGRVAFDLPALAGGYDGAGIGVHIPYQQPAGDQILDVDNRTYNALLRGLRCIGERGFVVLTGRWRTLRHITASPGKIGDIAKAALVLTHFEHGRLN